MSLSALLVLADGRLPAGGHAHSGGVEAAVAAGRVRDLVTLESFLVGRTVTAGVMAAACAAATCHAAIPDEPAAGSDPDRSAARERLVTLDGGVDARIASPVARAASRAQGRALLRATARIWPAAPLPGGTSANPHHPVAVGIAAAAAGLRPREAALVAVYGGLTGAASAAVRLLGLDPFAVHALVARLAGECDRVAAASVAYADAPVDDLPAGSAILLDVDAERHATWEVRLFAS